MSEHKKTTIVSSFTKGNKVLRCTTTRTHQDGKGTNFGEIFLNGDNPFPCYAMATSFQRFREYLENDGWVMNPEIKMKIETRVTEMGMTVISTYETTLIDRGVSKVFIKKGVES